MSYEDLGAQVEAAWAATGYKEQEFRRTAKRVLAAATHAELAACVPSRDNPRFRIDVRDVTDTSAEIRHDAHDGAWRVSEGRGIVSRYAFSRYAFTRDPSTPSGTPAGAALTVQPGALQQLDAFMFHAEAGAGEIGPAIECVFPLTARLRIVVITTSATERPMLYQRPGVELPDRGELAKLKGKQPGQFGKTIDYACGFYDVIETLEAARKTLTTELGFFLALLMTQHSREFLIDLIQEAGRKDRIEALGLVAQWVKELIGWNVLQEMESVAFPHFFTGAWNDMKPPAEAILFLLRHVRGHGDRLPPPVSS